MTDYYNQRSQDHAESPYATLPGTSQTGFVPHHMTAMKSNLAPGREVIGCSPTRWIYELLNNKFTVCDLFERARHAQLESTYTWDHPHNLVMNGNQSFSTDCSRILSTICLDCHFHFVFKMGWDSAHSDSLCHPSQASWPLQDHQFPWHHLVWVGSGSDPDIGKGSTKYYPLLARENFVCSAPPCTFQLTLEVSEPRMPQSWIGLLLDRETIIQQLRVAREQEPERYEGVTDDWADQAPLNLNTYLKNLLECSPEDTRTISKRNRRFQVLFGPRCYDMFRELRFTEKIETRAGVDEGSFTPSPPSPPGGPSGSTEIGTFRSYLEDIRSEVQCLIHKAGQVGERPTIITPVLHADLGCEQAVSLSSNADVVAMTDAPRYKLIGVLPNQGREVVVNAYKRQWELLPSRRKDLVESLMGIASDTIDELLSDYAITQSSVFDNQAHIPEFDDDGSLVPQALNYLGLYSHHTYGAGSVIEAFRRKLAQSPADATTARSMLLIIAQASDNDLYQAQLLMEVDAKMSLDTSLAVLGVSHADGPWPLVSDAAKRKLEASKSKDESQVYIDAVEAIADHTYSPALRQAALEMRQEIGMLGFKENSSVDESKPVDFTTPVGLHNIGNTCYLNSLLQYLFTVKPVRDIVFNYDNVKLALTDESISSRLLGGNKMQMDRGEAVVAQAFAKELSDLFKNLMASKHAATKPSQRLANAVLLSTHTLLRNPQSSAEPSNRTDPPPLPERPYSTPLVSKSIEDVEDVEMTGLTATSVPEAAETARDPSSMTLIDREEGHSDPSHERMDKVPPTVYPGRGAEAQESGNVTKLEIPPRIAGQSEDTQVAECLPAEHHEHLTQDVEMTDAPDELESVDQKVLNALEHQKRSSGTDQQDVEEVMGSIINRLQAAIQPSCVDERTGIQLEKIMETFFVTTINYTKKFDEKEYQSEISFDRAITAFPAPDGACSLYDALGRNFDQQILEESKLSRYTSIKALPPVLHILIQRSQSMGSKNGNAVVIPETLYMDRYMDAPHDSPIFRRRVAAWALSDRIHDIKAQIAKIDNHPNYLSHLEDCSRGVMQIVESSVEHGATDPTIAAGGETTETTRSAQEESWDFDGPLDDDFLLVNPVTTVSDSDQLIHVESKALSIRVTDTALRQMMESELQQREQMLKEQQDSLKGMPYRLHAVICHRGQLMSGHYWVWIHDFEDNVWRWYNDDDVKENKNTKEVLELLSSSGEPYFLCYVRDEDKMKFVNVPKRQPPTPPKATPVSPSSEMVIDREAHAGALEDSLLPGAASAGDDDGTASSTPKASAANNASAITPVTEIAELDAETTHEGRMNGHL